MNYNRIHSYYKLIEIMKKLSFNDKLLFLYGYFYKKVSYEYLAWLYSYLDWGVNDYKESVNEYIGELNQTGQKMYLCELHSFMHHEENSIYKLEPNEEIIQQEIIKIKEKYDLTKAEEIKKYKYEIVDIISKSFFNTLENPQIKNQLFEFFQKNIIDLSLVPYEYQKNIFLLDIPWMINKSYHDNDCDKLTGATYYNGLIRSGVCRHYSNFIKAVLYDLDIYTVNVIGRSGAFHSWNMIKINDEIKFIDITREIHLRNNAKKYNFNKMDWFLISIDEMFALEPDRDIRQLDDKVLDVFITKDNYQENMEILYNAFNNKTKVKKKDLMD